MTTLISRVYATFGENQSMDSKQNNALYTWRKKYTTFEAVFDAASRNNWNDSTENAKRSLFSGMPTVCKVWSKSIQFAIGGDIRDSGCQSDLADIVQYAYKLPVDNNNNDIDLKTYFTLFFNSCK